MTDCSQKLIFSFVERLQVQDKMDTTDGEPDKNPENRSSSTVHFKHEKFKRLLEELDSNDSQVAYRSLSTIRSKYVTGENQSSAKHLVSFGLVSKLVPLLERPNSKIVNVTLSILGNLTLHRKPREKFLESRGPEAMYNILTTLNEPNILGRGSRVVGNAAQDKDVRARLLSIGVLGALVKNLVEVSSPVAKSSIIRAIRVLTSHDISRAREILSHNVVASVSLCLHSHCDELVKSTVKFLATLSGMIFSYDMATQIQGGDGKGFEQLVKLCECSKSSTWEAALATVVNLSQLENLRPGLGNAGVVSAIMSKVLDHGPSLRFPTYSRSVRSLCLYTRESVNRIKLRQSGALKLFVRILTSRAAVDCELHDCVIGSILNFFYDDNSLQVFQQEGLILALIEFIEEHVSENFQLHSCEEEICSQDLQKDEEISKKSLTEEDLIESEPPKIVADASPILPIETNETDTSEGTDAGHSLETSSEIPFLATQEESVGGSSEVESRINELKKFRVNSPSYQAVQDEVLAFSRIRDEYLSCSSPAVSLYPSTFSSPDRLSPQESLQSTPFQSPQRSESDSSDIEMEVDFTEDFDKTTNEAGDRYSPVESHSESDDDETDLESEVGSSNGSSAMPQQTVLPPTPRRTTPTTTPLSPLQYLAPFCPIASTSNESRGGSSHDEGSSRRKSKDDPDSTRISQILHLLSRMTHFDVPHEHLTSLKTTQTIFKYLCFTKNPSQRAERILIRVSKNLSCLMAYVYQCQLSWLKLETESRRTLPDSACQSCLEIHDLVNQLVMNFSLLAETGYAEGVMCHALVKGLLAEKQTIAVGIPILIRPRKLLRNVLVSHGGLDILTEILETVDCAEALFSYAVLSVKILAEHVGVVSPELKLSEPMIEARSCVYDRSPRNRDLLVKLDSGETVGVNREVLSNASHVFEAMLSGQFAESSQAEISMKFVSKAATVGLFHYLYGCRNCRYLRNLDVNAMLDLVALSDKYLLTEFNRTLSGRIVRHCLVAEDVAVIYEKSLQNNYPVLGLEETLSICAVNFILVGNFSHLKRVEIFRELIRSKMSQDFIDDVSKTIQDKL